ncbi:TetR/AcrR family transcriptional regulator C-terminal domain-containing protein [Glycomyces niveus]|uniref:TetR/AcrR family transcriptional regulator C-terminal domain-containing protein n=1 Tax=Glycomyces niveus TaxID=2820287 RepID=A0ABS3U8P2_9ACTN|nr:TetR/AcrR family transcriptional regulator C-terminal domain-containing protein [Glycomyces sp. NEAU-S30]
MPKIAAEPGSWTQVQVSPGRLAAADQLTWLVIGSPLNRCLLTGTEGAAEDAAPVADAVDLFLAGYGT